MIRVMSEDTFNVNITSTFMDLYKQVKENWTSEFYKSTSEKALTNFRRRSPFVPYALKNDTGSPLKFTTRVSDLDTPEQAVEREDDEDNNWFVAEPGDVIPFSFTSRGK